VYTIVERWRKGPIGPPPRPARLMAGRRPTFTVAPLGQVPLKGDATRPRAVAGTEVVAQLRVRRDVPGCLVALEDGRYAMVGPLVAVGARQLLSSWATRRLRRLPADDSERAWLQNVIGALAADLHG
jgi:cell volume regulation protein A